jgi:predicted DNA-binding WGR domain protein
MTSREKRTLEHNQCCFYRLSVQPTLFGESCLKRGWDRIGRFDRRAMTTFHAEGATADPLARNVRQNNDAAMLLGPTSDCGWLCS